MKLALLGFGRFGQLTAKQLVKDFDLFVFDSNPSLKEKVNQLEAKWRGIENLKLCEIVVVATPISQLPQTLDWLTPHLSAEALVVDVCSVKRWPLILMKEKLRSMANEKPEMLQDATCSNIFAVVNDMQHYTLWFNPELQSMLPQIFLILQAITEL